MTSLKEQCFSQEIEPKSLSAAFMFPGQGLAPKDICNYYHFLKDSDKKLVSDYFSLAQNIINEINPNHGFCLEKDLSDEKSPNFQKTSFVQPVVYTLSVLSYDMENAKLRRSGVKPHFFLGHSLGEYSALTTAGAIKFQDGIKLVTYRGKFMQEVCEEEVTKPKTAHISILGLTEDKVKKICENRKNTDAHIALLNAPDLIVLGAPVETLATIEETAKNMGARRTAKLSTAGAFHTRYMANAAIKLAEVLGKTELSKPEHPIVTNFSGRPVEDPETLKKHLIESLTNPVMWSGSLEFLKNAGIEAFVEIGPGSSLSSLNKRNNIPESQIKNSNHL